MPMTINCSLVERSTKLQETGMLNHEVESGCLAGSLNRLTGHPRRLASGKQPAHRSCKKREAEKDHQKIGHGYVSERGNPTLGGVTSQPGNDADVGGKRAEDATEEAERAVVRYRSLRLA
jgi:hypothetical protein